MKKNRCRKCKKYVEQDSVVRVGLSSYCSFECSWDQKPAKKKAKPKKVAPDTKVSEQLRNHVIAKDNFCCRLCKGRNNLAVHHVIYKSDKFNKPWQDQASNLITLCNQPCHLGIVHKNKKRFEPLCLGIIWLRETQGDRYTSIYQLEKRLENACN